MILEWYSIDFDENGNLTDQHIDLNENISYEGFL